MVNFVLDTTTNSNGYDLTSIVSLTGCGTGQQTRLKHWYDVAVKYVGGSSYVDLFSVGYSLANNSRSSQGEVQVTTVDDSVAGLLASGVSEIRITFHAGTNLEALYREMDVTGSPTVPEPSTLALLARAYWGCWPTPGGSVSEQPFPQLFAREGNGKCDF